MNDNGSSPVVPLRISNSTPFRTRTPPHNAPNAALVGALTAFVKSDTPVTTTVAAKKSDGSLAASRISLPTSVVGTPLTGSNTGSSTQEREGRSQRAIAKKQQSLSELDGKRPGLHSPSTTTANSALRDSFAAAIIAAARHRKDILSLGTNIAQSFPAERKPQVGIVVGKSRATPGNVPKKAMERAGVSKGHGPDVAPIEPTKSLVQLFEQQSRPATEKASSKSIGLSRQPSTTHKSPPPVIAPKPQRTLSLRSVSSELPESRPIPILDKKPRIPGRNGTLDLSERPLIPAHGGQTEQIDIGHAMSASTGTPMANERPLAQSHAVNSRNSAPRPDLPPPRKTKGTAVTMRGLTSESDTALVKPGSTLKPPPRIPAREALEIRPQYSGPIQPSNPKRASPAPYQDRSRALLTPHITGDSLANAMVGATLAIKATSPPKDLLAPPPVPASRRKPKNESHNHHALDSLHRSRSLSPQKRQPGKLLTTLRGEDVADARKNKKHHFRKPNAHHEGTRERWREQVSEKERKRYEGVWAANKGLFLSSDDSEGGLVLDLVVRDIWSRSRLPAEKLRRIWDLVTASDGPEQSGTRSLTRDQFVVGLWFVDQILKGRNLPHSVNTSVWTSVQLRGVKVRLEGKGKDGRRLERGEAW